MSSEPQFDIAVLAGDGIGPEITVPCLALLDTVSAKVGGFALRFKDLPAGAAVYRDTGTAFPDSSRTACRNADAILLAAMGLPDIRYSDGTEISPQIELRFMFDLYAGIRPVRLIPGLALPLADSRAHSVDFVLIRESTEGLFASHGKGEVQDDTVARDTLVITRDNSERLFDFAFRLAERRKKRGHPGRVTCVDKANVFASFAFFRKIFDERATAFRDIDADYSYVDAMALNMVRQPWAYDVLVTENMFGDILSDLGAALMGGMGMAPSADIGDEHAVFQPCHGSAPDIAGQGKANPTAMFLSAAMMLDWLGDKHGNKHCGRAADLIVGAVDNSFRDGNLVPFELGGTAGTKAITDAVMTSLDVLPARQPVTSAAS